MHARTHTTALSSILRRPLPGERLLCCLYRSMKKLERERRQKRAPSTRAGGFFARAIYFCRCVCELPYIAISVRAAHAFSSSLPLPSLYTITHISVLFANPPGSRLEHSACNVHAIFLLESRQPRIRERERKGRQKLLDCLPIIMPDYHKHKRAKHTLVQMHNCVVNFFFSLLVFLFIAR